ncbi:MAG: rod shape-determining protein RodA [Clostridia bacterium]|nr:rod shape-determining protein RodA [Clostridia bacterium]
MSGFKLRKREFKNMEWGLLIVAIILTVIGLVALFSATQQTEFDEFKKQILWFIASIIIMVIVMLINYELLVRLSPIFYGISTILLIAVLFTKPINGATSWFDIGGFSLQPSEFAKIVVILFLTLIISKIQEKYMEDINKPTRLLIILAIVFFPLLLIIKQPDFGTAIAFCVALAMMLFTAGIDKKYILGTLLVILISVPIVYNLILPDHAKKRIDIYLNPESDPRGSGYNIIQSKLAIGAGQLTGMGILKGNQTQLGYLYPKTTDFIYSVIGEEMGFIIAATIVILYVLLITKALYIAKTAKDNKGALIASGIAGIFFFHMAENIGMVMGLLPITGVPLLFVSYGGSSLITSYIFIGILLNISSKRQKTIFVK